MLYDYKVTSLFRIEKIRGVTKELVQMRVAQGFIQLPNGSNVTMKDIGARYFDILLSRSLFQDVFKDERGKVEYCKMHDHIYAVACAISNDQHLRKDLITDEKSHGL